MDDSTAYRIETEPECSFCSPLRTNEDPADELLFGVLLCCLIASFFPRGSNDNTSKYIGVQNVPLLVKKAPERYRQLSEEAAPPCENKRVLEAVSRCEVLVRSGKGSPTCWCMRCAAAVAVVLRSPAPSTSLSDRHFTHDGLSDDDVDDAIDTSAAYFSKMVTEDMYGILVQASDGQAPRCQALGTSELAQSLSSEEAS
ncbi:unnamed protein product [Heligmosomoides polygyrus]|uniref:Protein kinase domain-containing protein n=1 Tax=Heligmosomoides polygyrus TaxID=6339 RepID=A0A3P8CAN1_HELPZ|nr:unnamed protein product [Heligmosomoides polygyrus]